MQLEQESVVYGVIKDSIIAASDEDIHKHRQTNLLALKRLPSFDEWPLISREMFSTPKTKPTIETLQTEVIHFGSAYRGIEYEWNEWINHFEQLLQSMYWVSATVHLQTELNGSHTFCWECEGDYHKPSEDTLAVRCEWTREAVNF